MMKKLYCPLTELNLPVVLRNGQSFRLSTNNIPRRKRVDVCLRWEKEADKDDSLVGVMGHRVWRLARTDPDHISYQVLGRFPFTGTPGECDETEDEYLLRDYFQLDDISLGRLYADWDKDPVFKKLVAAQPETLSGIRLLRQDPLECLISFIASSNNNITRIALMIRRLCETFGESLECPEGIFHDFPTLDTLSDEPKVESALRGAGFGYRAKYVAKTCAMLSGKEEGGEAWLQALRGAEYPDAHAALTHLPGVGSKVADCVCLMSLDKLGAIPVDVHVANITRLHYLPSLPHNSALTPATHKAVGDLWRGKFGAYAGWAQTILFSADLKRFAPPKLPTPKKTKKAKPTKTVKKAAKKKL